MQSIRSKLIIWLIKNRHLLEFKLKPEIVDENFSVEKFRNGVDKATEKMKMPNDTTVKKTKINNMCAEWILPPQYSEDKVLIYIHGGGFISGSCKTHRVQVAKFAKVSGLKSLLFDYRLAPEFPFPAAVDDCVEAYQWVLDQKYNPDNIVVGGESAGGTLTLSLLLALKEKGIPYPKAAFSISPITDLRALAETIISNAKKDIVPRGDYNIWMNFYIADNDPTNPILSPQFGNLEGLPPIYVCVGTHEVHLDDCINIAKKAEEQGVQVTLAKWPKMVHAFPMLSPLFPEAKKAFKDICDFANQQLHQ